MAPNETRSAACDGALTAIGTNGLSVAAAYGMLVAVFQHSRAKGVAAAVVSLLEARRRRLPSVAPVPARGAMVDA